MALTSGQFDAVSRRGVQCLISLIEGRPVPPFWNKLTVGKSAYDLFEGLVMLLLTLVIVVIVGFATWHLIISVVVLILKDQLNPGDPTIFQGVFGMFFTVVIGLEFKRSLLVVSGNRDSVVRVRSIILIGMLATVRKFIVLDLASVDAPELLAVAGAILALGIVYWLVRDQDRKTAAVKPPAA